MRIGCPVAFLHMLKECRVRLSLVMIAFKNLVYYFLNAAVLIFGQVISFFKLHVCGFCKAYDQE